MIAKTLKDDVRGHGDGVHLHTEPGTVRAMAGDAERVLGNASDNGPIRRRFSFFIP
jgi:hypothetical protein